MEEHGLKKLLRKTSLESTRLRGKGKELEEKIDKLSIQIGLTHGIFKPSRVNKRISTECQLIGPTTVPSFSESTYCCSSTNVTGSCIGPELF